MTRRIHWLVCFFDFWRSPDFNGDQISWRTAAAVASVFYKPNTKLIHGREKNNE
jgi:hypothetical protein